MKTSVSEITWFYIFKVKMHYINFDVSSFVETKNQIHLFESFKWLQNKEFKSKKKVGEGVSLVCRSDINMHRMSSGVKQSFEHGVWHLIFKNITIKCAGIYRPPSLATAYQFVLYFCQFV